MIEADHKQHQQHIFAELLPRMFLHKQIQEHRQKLLVLKRVFGQKAATQQ